MAIIGRWSASFQRISLLKASAVPKIGSDHKCMEKRRKCVFQAMSDVPLDAGTSGTIRDILGQILVSQALRVGPQVGGHRDHGVSGDGGGHLGHDVESC